MTKKPSGRPEFRAWVDAQSAPGWGLMPLTHIAKGLGAEDIIRDGRLKAQKRRASKESYAYLFYGRPGYRVGGDGPIRVEAACPYCFIFSEAVIKNAREIFPFDTGAFNNRMYKHALLDEMQVEDFSLGADSSRPNKIIAKVFSSRRTYFDADTTKMVEPEVAAQPWEFLPRAYLNLLASRGRNEPDDRICSIEIVFGQDIPLKGNLRAVVVPHTIWGTGQSAPWLQRLNREGIEIAPYNFIPNRNPEYYHALLESAVRDLFIKWNKI
jgi:hypothetical protein